jgi:hypothetical protein
MYRYAGRPANVCPKRKLAKVSFLEDQLSLPALSSLAAALTASSTVLQPVGVKMTKGQ